MELCLLNLLILIFLCVLFLPLVCSYRACNMWLTRNHMFIRDIWGKFISFIFWNFEISLVSFGRFQNFEKVNSVNVSQISLLSMWLLIQLFLKFPWCCLCSAPVYLVTLYEKISELKEKHATLLDEMKRRETPAEERERLLRQVPPCECFYHFHYRI